jgi:hypothetical protein
MIKFSEVTWYSKLAAVIVALCIFAVAFLLGVKYSNINSFSKVPVSNNQISALGKPCTYGEPFVKGLQCYFYGEVDESIGMRHSMWIVPTLPIINSFQLVDKTFYNAATVSWKSYRSPDGKVSFKIPAGTTMELIDNSYVIFDHETPIFSIDKFIENEDLDTRANIILDNGEVSLVNKEEVTFEGENATAITTAGQSNFDGYKYYLLTERDGQQYQVNISLYGNSFYEFMANAFLTTVSLK